MLNMVHDGYGPIPQLGYNNTFFPLYCIDIDCTCTSLCMYAYMFLC